MSTAIIVDDEPNLIEDLQHKLAQNWPELSIVSTAGNGDAALAAVEEHQPDFVFLDVRMPGMNGIEVARRIGDRARVIFVTAYDEYAVDAFEAAAVDYLLKPVSRDRLAATVRRLRQPTATTATTTPKELAALLEQLSPGPPKYLRWLRAGNAETTQLVDVSEVIYLKAEHKYTSLFTDQGEHLIRTSLSALEEQLDPEQFWRVHRSYMVNVERISEARRDLRGRYVLTLKGCKEKIRTSQAYGHLFKQM